MGAGRRGSRSAGRKGGPATEVDSGAARRLGALFARPFFVV